MKKKTMILFTIFLIFINIFKFPTQASNLERLLSLEEMNNLVSEKGQFLVNGMPLLEWEQAISSEWEVLNKEMISNPGNFDISNFYSYSDISNFIKYYNTYDNVNGYVIGYSVNRNPIYSLEIGSGNYVILLTGSTHARETAGTSFLLKMIEELLVKSQSDQRTKDLLNVFKIIVIPCVNPDGRILLESNPNSSWKSNAAGIDLNRNMPTANASQLKTGFQQENLFAEDPGESFFPGYYLGSEPETKAVINVMNQYKGTIIRYVDFHQAGRVIYGGKPSGTSMNEISSDRFAEFLIQTMKENGGVSYKIIEEEDEMKGVGEGSFTDMMLELVENYKFNTLFGRLGIQTELGILPILFYEDSDLVQNIHPQNNLFFASATFEIGTMQARGYTQKARNLQEKEYQKQGMSTLLNKIMENALLQLNP